MKQLLLLIIISDPLSNFLRGKHGSTLGAQLNMETNSLLAAHGSYTICGSCHVINFLTPTKVKIHIELLLLTINC